MKNKTDLAMLPRVDGAMVAVVQSKWYVEYTDLVVKKCTEILKAQGASSDHHVLPGTMELPLACQSLARTKRYDAIVCIGVIIKGETQHFEMIVNETARGLGQIMLNEDVPIVIEIIPATSLEQVVERTADDEFNKGIEAAAAACEVIDWRRLALAS